MRNRAMAMVTGGSRGIGKGIALELAGIGYDILICYFDFSEGRADDLTALNTKDEIQERGAVCEVFRADISQSEDRRKLIELAKEKFERCDLLVNNAGVAPLKRADLLEATEESFERVININLKGPYFLTQQVANWMIEQQQTHPERSFRIINISSISSFTSSPARGEYCISKAGISMMTKLYADRLAEHGIGVFEIQPGIIQTEMTAVVKEKYDKLISDGLLPTPRWGLPEDISRVIGAIARGNLDYSTGQVIHVDGGFHLRRL